MNRDQGICIILLLILVIGLLGCMTFFAYQEDLQIEELAKWEYYLTAPDDLSLRTTLNTLGDQGWELVFTRRVRDSSTEEYLYEMIFKRRRKEESKGE